MARWLLKSEPEAYSWDRLVADGRGTWDGVRNYMARNHLRAMKTGDLAFFYHSVKGKAVVGICRVVAEHYPDPTAEEGDWSVVDVAPVRPLERPVALSELKTAPELAGCALFRYNRLSVVPLTDAEFDAIERLARQAP